MAELNELGTLLGLMQQGFTPEQARQQLDEARAMQMAKMTGREMTRMGLIQGAQDLRRGLMSALGQESQDPTLQMASRIRQLGTQFNTATSEGLMQFANALQQVNPEMARQVAKQAQDLAQKEALVGKTKAETSKALTEGLTADQRNASALADSKGLERGSEAWTKEYNKQLTRLTTKEGTGSAVQKLLTERGAYKPDSPEYKIYTDLINKERGVDVKPSQDFILAAGSLGIAQKPFLSDYSVEELSKVKTAIEEADIKKRKAGAITLDMRGPTAFATKLGELDAKTVGDAMAARNNAESSLRSLNEMSRLTDQGLISGTFATGRTGATNFLDTLGLTSASDKEKLARSENYVKVAGDVVLGTLGGRLGAGFSNEDRKFIQGLVPQLENSPLARRQLIDFMRKKFTDISEEATRLEDYARTNNGLKGYKPKTQLPSSTSAVSSMSVEDLAKAAGGKMIDGKFVPGRTQ